MRKPIFIFALLFITILSIHARKPKFFGWFHITPKVGIGTSMMFNSEMFNSETIAPNAFNTAYLFGGQMGASFMDILDASIEVNFNVWNQLYTINLDGMNYEKNLNFVNMEYGLVFKYMTSSGYVELGSTINNNTTLKFENVINTGTVEGGFNDNTEYFAKNHINLVTGFGVSVIQKDLFEIMVGARFKYGLKPVYTGSEFPIDDGVYDEPFLQSNVKHRQMTAMVELNIYNFFGFFGKAICGNKAVVLFQKPTRLW